MAGSLFLAALASICPVMATTYWLWIVIWALVTSALGYGFRKARKREVDYCYLNLLIVTHVAPTHKNKVPL